MRIFRITNIADADFHPIVDAFYDEGAVELDTAIGRVVLAHRDIDDMGGVSPTYWVGVHMYSLVVAQLPQGHIGFVNTYFSNLPQNAKDSLAALLMRFESERITNIADAELLSRGARAEEAGEPVLRLRVPEVF